MWARARGAVVAAVAGGSFEGPLWAAAAQRHAVMILKRYKLMSRKFIDNIFYRE